MISCGGYGCDSRRHTAGNTERKTPVTAPGRQRVRPSAETRFAGSMLFVRQRGATQHGYAECCMNDEARRRQNARHCYRPSF